MLCNIYKYILNCINIFSNKYWRFPITVCDVSTVYVGIKNLIIKISAYDNTVNPR